MSKATMYRYFKQFGAEVPVTGPVKGRCGVSKYAGLRHDAEPRT